MFLHAHTGIRFAESAMIGWGLFLAYLLAAVISAPPPGWSTLMVTAGAVALCSIVVMFTNYNFEIALRRRFRTGRLLSRELGKAGELTERAAAAERELSDAIEALPDGFAIFDAQEKLTLCNDVFARMAAANGVPIGKGGDLAPVMAQVLDPDTAAEDPNVPSRLDHWWRQVGEIECPSRAGDWHRASVQRLHDGRMVCLVSNITKAKLRDEKIAQANKMESLGKLTGGVAHEFNNLLQVIITNLHFLLVDGTDQQNSGEKVGGPALKALQAAKRGAAITHGLLSYAHNQFLEPRTIDLVEIIGETLDILKPGLREDIQIGTHLTPDAWSPRVDAMHLQNALINIAVNAQEAMPNGGTLTFEVENVPSLDSHLRELAGDDVGDHVLVAVTDTGDGIAPDVLERVFEPFFTTKGLANNSGLGLSVVQGFVQQSGGVIDAQSTPGKGTSLRLYLPRAPITRDVDTEFAPQRRSADAEGRILLVEDDDAVRDSLRMLLEISGYSVIEAADGETALDLFETESFALVLTDIALPGGKDGREIARLVRAKNPNLPFVFISGYAEEIELMARNLRPGDQLLAKPFDPDVLEAMINQALAG
jgi:signal transduction histidine kinase/CheY-like chemotaxis protein